MAGLIERKAKTDITVKTQAFVDGEPVFTDGKTTYTDLPAKCMVLDMSQEDLDYFGRIKNGTIFLIAPFAGTMAETCQIVHKGKTYDSKGIRTIKNMKSEIVGYKVAVA